MSEKKLFLLIFLGGILHHLAIKFLILENYLQKMANLERKNSCIEFWIKK
jgi:hypothetical protein